MHGLASHVKRAEPMQALVSAAEEGVCARGDGGVLFVGGPKASLFEKPAPTAPGGDADRSAG